MPDNLTLAQRLLPESKRDDMLSQLFVYLCLVATATAIIAATMSWSYGHTTLAALIYIAAATFPIALIVLRYINSTIAAGHYLSGNILIQSIFLAANPAVSTVILVPLAAGTALLGKNSSRFWLSVIVLRCLYVAYTAANESASATAAVAALSSVIVSFVIQLSEQARTRSARRAKERDKINKQRAAVLNKLVKNNFDMVIQAFKEDIFYVSPSVKKLLGYTRENFIDRSLSYYLHPDEPGLPGRLTPEKAPFREVLRLRHADGRWVWVEAYCTPGLLGSNPNQVYIVLRDYEQERKVVDQLTQAQRLEGMGSMAAAVAHDFNNMLTVIMGIADELPDGAAAREIRRVAGNAAAITNKLLTFGSGTRTSSEIQDLSHLMSEQSLLLQHASDSRYIVVESYVEDPLLVRIDESQFEQVLINLVNNAREAMPDGGELEVSLHSVELDANSLKDGESDTSGNKAGHYAVLEVGDSGVGIDAETQAKIFDPFFSTKQSQNNNGLGLSSCYGIVSQYGGYIEVDSMINQGTTVRVYLPIAETRDHEPTLDVIDNEISIMIVDDDPGVVRVVRSALLRAGFNVRGFTDVTAAREFFRADKVSLLVSDVVMPGIAGTEFVKDLRLQAPNLPVLYISGFTNEALDDWIPDEQNSYLAKPFRGEEIVARVSALLKLPTNRKING